jgi:hypothetical protein
MQALKEGFITENDLTDESIENSVCKSWTFVPKVISVNRRDYLESCIYLVARNSYLGQKITVFLRRRDNCLLGFIVNIMARYKYFLMFKSPKWLRQPLTGSKLLISGNTKELITKIKRKLD